MLLFSTSNRRAAAALLKIQKNFLRVTRPLRKILHGCARFDTARESEGHNVASNNPAAPIPPPTHIVTMPYFFLLRRSS